MFGGVPAAETVTPGEPAWLDDFMNSEVYAEQDRLLGRAGPNKDHMRKVLAALDAGGGTLLMDALAQATRASIGAAKSR